MIRSSKDAIKEFVSRHEEEEIEAIGSLREKLQRYSPHLYAELLEVDKVHTQYDWDDIKDDSWYNPEIDEMLKPYTEFGKRRMLQQQDDESI